MHVMPDGFGAWKRPISNDKSGDREAAGD